MGRYATTGRILLHREIATVRRDTIRSFRAQCETATESRDGDLSAAGELTLTPSYLSDGGATTAQESVLNDECHPNDFGLAVGVGDQLSDADKNMIPD